MPRARFYPTRRDARRDAARDAARDRRAKIRRDGRPRVRRARASASRAARRRARGDANRRYRTRRRAHRGAVCDVFGARCFIDARSRAWSSLTSHRRDASRSRRRRAARGRSRGRLDASRRARGLCFGRTFGGDVDARARRARVLVKVHACSLNPVDGKYLYGDKCPKAFCSLVRRVVEGAGVGFDFSGVVVAADADAGFRRGQAVFGVAPPLEGACAEFVECYADLLAEKSANMTHAEAAAIGLCGVTICQALDTFSKVVPSPVLVVGASGGLGHLAVQICKAEGAEVVGVSSTRNLEFVRSLGVDAAVPYDDPNSTLEEHLADWRHSRKKFKLILDTVTSNATVDAQYDYCSRLREIVDDDCRYVKFGGSPTQWAFAHIRRIGVRVPFSDFHKRAPPFWVYFRGVERQLRYLRDMYDAGDLKPRVGHRFAFTDEGVRAALTLLRSRRAVGKIIIDIDEN